MAILVDTVVESEVTRELVDKARTFFSLPRGRKDEFIIPSEGYPPRSDARITFPRGRGYEVQEEVSVPGAESRIINEWLMVRDSSASYNASDAYFTNAEGLEFYSPIEKHPEQETWPEEVPGLKEAATSYYRSAEQLAGIMYDMFSLSLGLPRDFFASKAKHGPIWPVKIAHYPKQDEAPPEDQQRISPHYDRTLFSMITTTDLQEQAMGSGLQILVDRHTGNAVDGRNAENAVWRNVPIVENSFVINVGEMMARWTNGHFKHVVHRVPNPIPDEANAVVSGRISLLAFVILDYDTPVEVIPSVIEEEEVVKYNRTWVGELYNWGSELPIYNKEAQEKMRLAQGLYDTKGHQDRTLATVLPTEHRDILN
mmetsp:Transcript_44089/g.99625  ORF Transcript_44089/g.99625 Transcript_44089/m.99625 type:complete len:369 (-) Transcript_44089:232-1338(-)|eukprot:CAMPEP_0172588820 /NCGR_PEP_ID=MMETSP1068-20121228/7665_1 /TAXON_ID=35684 /ORGANISM="Pseudopedinella elastica, Strain CCMP716" /LENGTH=368 /DNA_ID=CAMNT_0013384265 /DNA_START=473 /DNA_END=1579 /DNA_ORIENTATION=-